MRWRLQGRRRVHSRFADGTSAPCQHPPRARTGGEEDAGSVSDTGGRCAIDGDGVVRGHVYVFSARAAAIGSGGVRVRRAKLGWRGLGCRAGLEPIPSCDRPIRDIPGHRPHHGEHGSARCAHHSGRVRSGGGSYRSRRGCDAVVSRCRSAGCARTAALAMAQRRHRVARRVGRGLRHRHQCNLARYRGRPGKRGTSQHHA